MMLLFVCEAFDAVGMVNGKCSKLVLRLKPGMLHTKFDTVVVPPETLL